MMTPKAEPVFPIPSTLGEGSLWDAVRGLLYWVDIAQHKVYAFDPHNGSNLAFDVGEDVGTVVLSRNDKLVLALRSGFAYLDPANGRVTPIADPEAHLENTRFNDGKCDPRGRFWAGTIVEGEREPIAALYCLDTELGVTKKVEGVRVSNGLVWSGDDRTFYYIDTPTQRVVAYDFDPESAAISNPRVAAEFPKELGSPDGMAIDKEDHLWIALFHGSKVIRVDPSNGRVVFEVDVPAHNVTSCAFGGPELDDLYITSARVGCTPAELEDKPLAGSLFRVRVPYRGVAATRFARDL